MISSPASWSFGGSDSSPGRNGRGLLNAGDEFRRRGGAGVSREARDAPQFYLTAPSACPYLPGQQERKIFTHLVGKRAAPLNDLLTQTGFRRSQTIAYRPACESCRACVSVRVLVDHFHPSDSQRRAMRARRASPAEKAELWPRVVAANEGYAGYQRCTRRDIPLVICEPRPGP